MVAKNYRGLTICLISSSILSTVALVSFVTWSNLTSLNPTTPVIYNGIFQKHIARRNHSSLNLDMLRVMKERIEGFNETGSFFNASSDISPAFEQIESNVAARNNTIGTLQRHHTTPDTTVVPNIAHYVWFGNNTFRFDHLISILSAYKIMKPDRILFHTDSEPRGRYWEEAKAKITTLQVFPRQAPLTIFNHTLNRKEHMSDVARLQILLQYGGVYTDLDVIHINSIEPLRHFDFVMGKASHNALNNGIIISSKNSKFLKLFYESYLYFNSSCWSCNSAYASYELSQVYPHLIRIEDNSLAQPNHQQTDLIFYGHFRWWEGHFTIHTWIRVFLKRARVHIYFTPENIRILDSAFGEMCRFIYYGRVDLIQNVADHAALTLLL
ncbi:uncharacterized protein LOC144356690 [Saccoglossus kowalevskii]